MPTSSTAMSRRRRHKGEGLAVCVVIAGITFQGERDDGHAVALGVLAGGGAAAVDVQGRHAVMPVADFLVEEQLDPQPGLGPPCPVSLPPAVGQAIDRAVSSRDRGPVLLNTNDARMDRHAATRRLHCLAEAAGIQIARAHPHMLRQTDVTTRFDAGAARSRRTISTRRSLPRSRRRAARPAGAGARASSAGRGLGQGDRAGTGCGQPE